MVIFEGWTVPFGFTASTSVHLPQILGKRPLNKDWSENKEALLECRGIASHAIAVLIWVSARRCADAAHQLRGGNPSPNSLALAPTETSDFALARDVTEEVRLINIETCRH